VRQIRALGRESFQIQADISRGEDVEKMVQAVREAWGGLDILVNNAGISGAGTSLHEITDEVWERMMQVNLKGVFLCSRAALPGMVEAGGGRIVNIASVAGISGMLACNAHYAAAKGGIVALTRRLARDYAPQGVTVNCIAPGLILDTGFNEKMEVDRVGSYVRQIPRGRPGNTRDVAGLAAFLASDEADYITGQVIAVDGGATC
jgi:3-oxoacyl-[acyl-carrier protein] reductase